MDVLGVVARMNTVSEDFLVYWVNSHVLDPLFSTKTPPEAIPLWRRSFITWFLVYFGSIFIYYFFGWLDYYFIFLRNEKRKNPSFRVNNKILWKEIWMSTWSLFVMSAFTTPMEVLVQLGYSKVYHNVEDYGWFYLLISPFLFVFFSDTLIYFIHLGLHHRLVYKHLHKPHHSFIDTTPFAAFAFHPIDGFLQGVPYQLYVFCLPIHATLHLISLTVVGVWTINIHDRVDLHIPGVNGAGHHRVHHKTFKSNYGQYTVFWDKVFGTFKDPVEWVNQGAKEDREEEVYGKKYL
ncbi:hypothetical protein GAYE_SCF07G2856 [Galdieria yellowstonensis]|uniref:Fatty acid hydroxylase domain-containing protein n=1 Tax=Galdieria yellowstonensis TaxID=3028027 RepID=A0AAV9IC16_9RHOD|nr:hypothetical protein GAYE_SCF07G2856 [Galdieria yellowstonensis]